MLILTVFIIIKVLVKSILIDHVFSQNYAMSNNIKKNYKYIASVIYRTSMSWLKESNLVIRNIDLEFYNDKSNEIKTKYFYKNEDKITEGEIEKKYILACKRVEKRKKIVNNNLSSDDIRDLSKITSNMKKYAGDKDKDEIFFISDDLYSYKDIEIFLKLSGENNFDLKGSIENLIIKLFNVLQKFWSRFNS
jgi:hypothetical protein